MVHQLRPESASNDVIAFYERNAHNFDKDRIRHLFEKSWLNKFLELIPVNGSIVDLGCGTGAPIAEYLIGRGFQVTGVDSSSRMIDLCKRRFPSQKWIMNDMRHIKFDRTFDGVLVWDSFFHLNHVDQQSMFSVFRACANSRAPLMFTAGPEHGEAVNPLWGEPLFHASFSKEEYDALLKKNGFEIVDFALNDQECGDHCIYLARHVA